MRCCSTAREGWARRTLALNLARGLLCESPGLDGIACGKRVPCCHYVAAGQHPDLQMIEPFVIDEDSTVKS